MAKGIKGITVEVGGNTAPLDKALKNVDSTARGLQTELNQVSKALKFDPTNITLVQQKQQILKEEITATKERLDTLKEAQKQVTAQYKAGKIDAGQFRAFQLELETTKAKLSNLKDQKKDVSVIGTAFEAVKEKVQGVLEKLEPVASGIQAVGKAAGGLAVGGVKVVGSAVDVAGKAFAAYTGAVTAAGGAAVAMTAKAAGAADEINTISAQTGLSTEQIQKFQYATELIDVPLETLTGSMAKLTRNMYSATDPTKGTGEAFAKLGVQVRDSNGELRNNQEVFNDAITALGSMSNETERDALAMQIFGKSAQDLNPLIKGGADALKVLGDNANDAGLILSQDALNNLNKYNDSIDVMKANTAAAGNVLGGVFAGSLTDLTTTVGDAIPAITGKLASIFSGDDLEGNAQDLTEWLQDTLVELIYTISDKLPQMIKGFNAVFLAIITALITVLPDMMSQIVQPLFQGFISLTSSIVELLPELIPTLVEGAITLFMGLLDGLNIIIPKLMDMLPGIIEQIGEMLIENAPQIITAGMEVLINLINGITDSIPQLIETVVALIPVIVKGLTDNLPALITAGIQLIVALAQGLPQAIPAIILALPEIINAIINGLFEQDWAQIGIDILKGIADGLVEGVKAIGKTIKSVASNLVDNFKNFLGIHSPSTVFADIVGKNMALGIEEGFLDTMDGVSKSMANAVPTSFEANMKTSGTGSYSGSNPAAVTAEAIAQALVGIGFSVDGRTFARLVREYANV